MTKLCTWYWTLQMHQVDSVADDCTHLSCKSVLWTHWESNTNLQSHFYNFQPTALMKQIFLTRFLELTIMIDDKSNYAEVQYLKIPNSRLRALPDCVRAFDGAYIWNSTNPACQPEDIWVSHRTVRKLHYSLLKSTAWSLPCNYARTRYRMLVCFAPTEAVKRNVLAGS